jgi:hypothetical protein
MELLRVQRLTRCSTTIYFTKLQSDSFMIHGEKYIASLYRPTHMQPPMCLQYAILAAGASASSIYGHMAEAFYVRARQYIQADEMKVRRHPSKLMNNITDIMNRAIANRSH